MNPISITEVLSTTPAADACARHETEWHRDYHADPDEWCQPGVCRSCSAVLDGPLVHGSEHLQFAVVYCEACIPREVERRKAEAALVEARKFEGLVPKEFVYWNSMLGNNELLSRALALFDITASRGLIIHGETAACKTRVAWELYKKVVAAGESALFCDAYDFATEGIPPEAAKVKFLFVDELGQEPKSVKYETALLRLIRKRCDNHRPIIITTQMTGARFKAQLFNGAAGDAILRRLNERTDKLPAITLKTAA